MNKGFSLFEVILVVAIIILIVISVPLTVNLRKQIGRGQDTKRKSELTALSHILEDYYNDKGHFPTPAEICYNPVSGQTSCNICGNQETPDAMKAYTTKLPCDPQYPAKNYLYQIDDEAAPSVFRIYTKFSTDDDPSIAEKDCQYGCGPYPNFFYSWGVTSTNTGLETRLVKCEDAAHLYTLVNNICNICGNYDQCKTNFGSTTVFYYNPDGFPADCSVPCKP